MIFLRNIAPKSEANRNNVNVDMAASDVVHKEFLYMLLIVEQAAREHPVIAKSK